MFRKDRFVPGVALQYGLLPIFRLLAFIYARRITRISTEFAMFSTASQSKCVIIPVPGMRDPKARTE